MSRQQEFGDGVEDNHTDESHEYSRLFRFLSEDRENLGVTVARTVALMPSMYDNVMETAKSGKAK